jgi:hypothetical protein
MTPETLEKTARHYDGGYEGLSSCPQNIPDWHPGQPCECGADEANAIIDRVAAALIDLAKVLP